MPLSDELISQFAKATTNNKSTNTESTVYGTIVVDDSQVFVRIDGSDRLTPVNITTDIVDGERVSVLIKNHTATVIGNFSSPSARTERVEEVAGEVIRVEGLIADFITVDELNAKYAVIEELVAGKVTTEQLDAKFAQVETLVAGKVTTEQLNAKFAEVNTLLAGYVTTDVLNAQVGNINTLIAGKLTAEEADIKYANVSFANINEAAIKKIYSDVGIIKDFVMSEGHVTGELVGVKIQGDLIEANTLVAKKLVLEGDDGLFYRINTDGKTVSKEQTDKNSISGTVITAKSVTADKISVTDLVAFGATIGGFKIGDNSIYSDVKNSVSNTTRGIYMDKDGQFALGDSTNYIKYYKDGDNWKLDMAASEFSWKLTSGETIDEAIGKTVVSATEQFYQSSSPSALSGGSWGNAQPTWTQGKYIWKRMIITYANGDTEYTPSANGVCITGNTGATGGTGPEGNGIVSTTITYQSHTSGTSTPTGTWYTSVPTVAEDNYLWTRTVITYKNGTSSTSYSVSKMGKKGDTGLSVSSVDVQYYLSSSSTSLSGGSWSTNAPNWVDGKYMWSKTVTAYSNGSTSESDPVCITGAKGSTGGTGKGISSIVEQYYQSTSNTSQTGGSWSTTVPTWSDGKYIWTRSVITYTDNSTVTTTAVCVTGGKGNTGKGISSTSITYQAGASGTSAPTGTWNTSVPGLSAGQYLWTKTVITYTDNTTSTSYSVGMKGTTGNGIKSTSVTYQSHTSGTSTPTGTWYTYVPTVAEDNYLWTKTVVTYDDNTTSTSYSVSKMGKKGDKGNGIKSTSVTYQSHTSGTSTPTGTWYTSIPSVSQGYYLWTKTVITYDDNTTSTSYSVARAGNDGDPGKDGQMLYATSSTSATTYAKTASLSTGSINSLTAGVSVTVKFTYANTHATPYLNVASKGSYQIKVGNVVPTSSIPYYWAAGAVITFVFDGSYWVVVDVGSTKMSLDSAGLVVGNYNSLGSLANNVLIGASDVQIRGGTTTYATYGANSATIGQTGTGYRNIHVDTDSVDIRNGTTVLASFEADTIYLGKDSETSTVNFGNGAATMKNTTDGALANTRFLISAGEEISLTAERGINNFVSWSSTTKSSNAKMEVHSHGYSESTPSAKVVLSATTSMNNNSGSVYSEVILSETTGISLQATNGTYTSMIQLQPEASVIHVAGELRTNAHIQLPYDKHLYGKNSSDDVRALIGYVSDGIQIGDSNNNSSNITFYGKPVFKNVNSARTNLSTWGYGFVSTDTNKTYPGLVRPDGTDTGYVRTPQTGIIPYQNGGHGTVGTSSWPFNNGYFKNLYSDKIIIPNKANVYGKNTSGAERSLIGCTEGNNISVGYGSYNAAEGQLNLYGNKIQMYVKSAGSNFKPYYEAGDSISDGAIWITGFVHATTTNMYFTVPLDKPVLASGVSVTSNSGLMVRQGGKFIYNSSDYISTGVKYNPTLSSDKKSVKINAVMPNSTNAVGNEVCAITASIIITFS